MSVRSCSLHFRFSSVFIFRSICWAVIAELSWFSTVSRCWWLMAMEYFILEASVLHIGKPFAGFSFQCLHIAHQFCWMVSIVFHFLQEYQLNLFCPIMANVSFLWSSSKRKLTWILSLIWLDKLSRFSVILEKSWSPSDVCNIHSLNLHSQDWKCIKKCSELHLYARHVWGREQPILHWHHKTWCIMYMNWTEVMIPYRVKSTYMAILSWEALFSSCKLNTRKGVPRRIS